jgi:predicted RNA binding protein YcfA (HicA-like mRNA interferase family)
MTAKALARIAETNGWRHVRRGGRQSHLIYAHPGRPYKIAIPNHGAKDIARGTLATILKQIDGTWSKQK